jgi:hypothetical protein
MPYSVIMGRGKEATNAIGNRRLQILVETQLGNYLKAKSRREKSFVVAHVLETVQGACPEGGFVKFDGRNWWEVDDNSAREKIGSMFRDRLHDQYKSSTKAKMARIREIKAQERSEKDLDSSTGGDETNSSSSSATIDVEPLPLNAFSQQVFDFIQMISSNPSDDESSVHELSESSGDSWSS